MANLFSGEGQLQPLDRTGVWFRSFVVSRATRAMYGFSSQATPGPTGGDWGSYYRSLVPDPHNPVGLHFNKDPDDPRDAAVVLSVLALPGAPPDRWGRGDRPVNWSETRHRFRSPHLPGSRLVWVYLPPGFAPQRTRYNLVIALDGVAYQSGVPTPRIVESLVENHRLTPTVLVLVGNARDAREVELLHHRGFVRFLATELVPWLRRRYRLRTPASRTVIAGSSLGGLTAAFAALCYPKVFGNVLAQSGAFSWSDSGDMLGSPTLMAEYARAPCAGTRFYLDAGTRETQVFPGTQASLLAGVRHLRDVLIAKGYPVTYAEFEGGHDYACWGVSLGDGLIQLIGTPGKEPPKLPMAPG